MLSHSSVKHDLLFGLTLHWVQCVGCVLRAYTLVRIRVRCYSGGVSARQPGFDRPARGPSRQFDARANNRVSEKARNTPLRTEAVVKTVKDEQRKSDLSRAASHCAFVAVKGPALSQSRSCLQWAF